MSSELTNALWRLETGSENIARDMAEGRFPEQSPPRMVPTDGLVESAAKALHSAGTAGFTVTYEDAARAVLMCAAPVISEQQRSIDAAAPEMLEALRKLAAEVGGLRTFESELRAELGNTNWSVLMLRLSEADSAIAKATKP